MEQNRPNNPANSKTHPDREVKISDILSRVRGNLLLKIGGIFPLLDERQLWDEKQIEGGTYDRMIRKAPRLTTINNCFERPVSLTPLLEHLSDQGMELNFHAGESHMREREGKSRLNVLAFTRRQTSVSVPIRALKILDGVVFQQCSISTTLVKYSSGEARFDVVELSDPIPAGCVNDVGACLITTTMAKMVGRKMPADDPREGWELGWRQDHTITSKWGFRIW